MKRWIVLFILIMPLCNALDCITYMDCPEPDCTGSARICAEEICLYSTCMEYEEPDGYDMVVNIAKRFLILAAAAVLIAFLFPVLNLHSKAKALAVIGFAILAIVFVFYLVTGPTTSRISDWSSELADSKMIPFLNTQQYDVTEKIIRTKEIAGKEYRLSDPLHETPVIIAQGDLTPAGVLDTTMNVYKQEQAFYTTLQWSRDDLFFSVTGDKEEVYSIVNKLLTEIIEIEETDPPDIHIKAPTKRYTNSNLVAFDITGVSPTNMSTISVNLPGFESHHCFMKDWAVNCTFEADLDTGETNLIIRARDELGVWAGKEYNFVFDNQPWELHSIYPENNSIVNVAKLHFKLIDISGIDIDTLKISSDLNKYCTVTKEGLECSDENAELTQGKNMIIIMAADNAGNHNRAGYGFTYDTTRPGIEITNKGFIVSDNIGIKDVMLDNKKYNLDNCNLIGKEHHCAYSKWIKSITVVDLAGNSNYVENMPSR